MAQQTIGIGTVANDGTGDPIRDAFDKCNDNFTELYTGLVGLLDFKGATDCSANPNYPSASKGDFYVVSVAGKIGGASGIVVEVGDAYFALADNAGGTQAGVGTSWTVLQANIVGGTITELDDIPDVNAPTPVAGDCLAWDNVNSEWVASPLPGGGAGGTVPDGGTTGQVLSKASGVDQDTAWVGGTGTSFPGSPSSGDRFYRTDRHIEYFYDGTRWLSLQLFTLPISDNERLDSHTTTGAWAKAANPWSSVYDIYVEHTIFVYFLSGTGNWTITLTANGNGSNISSGAFSTSGAWTAIKVTVNGVYTSALKEWETSVTENSGTATLFGNVAIVYRLIG